MQSSPQSWDFHNLIWNPCAAVHISVIFIIHIQTESSCLVKCYRQTHTCLYLSTLTPSSWLRRTRLVPTRILSSCRSFSLFSLSRLWPWCCIRTHNLFISAKFSRTKSMESLISPVISSVPLWSKDSLLQGSLKIKSIIWVLNYCVYVHYTCQFHNVLFFLPHNRSLMFFTLMFHRRPVCRSLYLTISLSHSLTLSLTHKADSTQTL